MENKLKLLFDYQKFARDRKLQSVIDAVRARPRELSLDETEFVSAAGSPYYKPSPSDDGSMENRP